MVNVCYDIEVEGKLDNLSKIADFVGVSLKKFKLDEHKVFEVQLAVDEAATNIIEYAYSNQPGNIWLMCCDENDRIKVVLKDVGAPFDPTTAPEPDLDSSVGERKIGGLGIYIAKKMTDDFMYDFVDGKNVLTLIKRK
jgi:serine/threonine-protein kinase RsbW